MAKCKYCGAEIKWIKTVTGKKMPCDPQLVYFKYVLGGKERIVTADGEVITCITDVPPNEANGTGYIPHWATCKGGVD